MKRNRQRHGLRLDEDDNLIDEFGCPAKLTVPVKKGFKVSLLLSTSRFKLAGRQNKTLKKGKWLLETGPPSEAEKQRHTHPKHKRV